MEESITAYQGKSFSVTLQSYLGSTNYGWCLISMPAEVILAGQSNESANGLSLVNQVFYFIAVDVPKKQPVELEFGLCCLTQQVSELNPFKYEERVKIAVNIVPSNDDDATNGRSFVKYSENAATYSPNNNLDLVAALKYGYPTLKYGYPTIMYGYPTLKYGYPPSQDDCSAEKYGYPVGDKYGYPCSQNDCSSEKYGYPIGHKYGYPSGYRYGYPCDQNE